MTNKFERFLCFLGLHTEVDYGSGEEEQARTLRDGTRLTSRTTFRMKACVDCGRTWKTGWRTYVQEVKDHEKEM